MHATRSHGPRGSVVREALRPLPCLGQRGASQTAFPRRNLRTSFRKVNQNPGHVLSSERAGLVPRGGTPFAPNCFDYRAWVSLSDCEPSRARARRAERVEAC
jgi:hypothetical protein